MISFSHKKSGLLCTLIVIMLALTIIVVPGSPLTTNPIEHTLQRAASDFGAPENLLKALCSMEGGFSMHAGSPNIDGGYGCNLTKNSRVDTLDRAAHGLGVSPTMLQQDLRTNIRGAAYILSEDARRLSYTHALPTDLAGWQGALELYSNSLVPAIAHLYANAVYTLLRRGFSARTEQGEVITVAPTPTPVPVQTTRVTPVEAQAADKLPAGCRKDGKTDYPGAIDCILQPEHHDCDLAPNDKVPCNYYPSSHFDSLYRQDDHTITHVVIHDIEGTVQSAIHAFEDPASNVASHYVINSDGTVYQVVREKDVAFHAGNFWYNQHSIGIEHAGYDATGFQWYNATMYLASAQLVTYLLNKYHIPLDHNHIVAHGAIPSLYRESGPNHIDPGPYWLWDYYLRLICLQQACEETPLVFQAPHMLVLHPQTSITPFARNGTETPANFNFFYLYKGPGTQSGLITQEGDGSDVTDESNTVEADVSYYYVNKVEDPDGTGDTMYEIWYGQANEKSAGKRSLYTHAKLVWLAVPPEAASTGIGTVVKLVSGDGSPIQVYSKPGRSTKTSNYTIGDAPDGSLFASGYTTIEDGTATVWYEINYNHRQAWVPASDVSVQGEATPIGAPWNRIFSYSPLKAAIFLLGLQILLALFIWKRKSH